MAILFTKLKPKWRWLQFSLRTMLLVVSVSCIALSLWVVPAERQRRAIAAIETLDGRVFYVDNQAASESFPVAFLRCWLPRIYFDEVETLVLDKTQVTDAGLAHLHGLASLQRLSLTNTQVTDAGLAHLHGLMSLQTLDLDNTQVTDAGLAHLQGLMSLQTLDLDNTQVTDAGLTHLGKALPKCQIIGP